MSIKSTHALLKQHSIRPKKRLGQHFLSAMPTVRKIVDTLEIESGDVVVEIGPGLGIMTGLIAEKAKRVYAIDADSSMIDIASEELKEFENIEWINDDILDVDLNKIVPESTKIKIIGNLPYNISSQILFWMLGNRTSISRALVMLQKEVAIRICAKAGGRDYGILSVLMQAFANCKKLFDVSAKSFVPPPEVSSSMIMIDFEGVDRKIADEGNFNKVVKAAFGKRRKTLRNSLLGAKNLKIDAKKLDAALAEARIDPRRRAETLKIDEFIRLSGLLNVN